VPTPPVAVPGPIPVSAGIGLRAVHHEALLADRPGVGWLEAHSENYFADGGTQLDYLTRLRELYPLSLHGVGLSLGSVDELDRDHLRRLRRLVDHLAPGLVSEHVCWGAIGGMHLNDLLPLPYTAEALHHLAARVSQLQDTLGRQVLLENVSSYLEFTTSEMSEADFLVAIARESGCGRPAARRQQRIRERAQSRLRCARLHRPHPAPARGRDSSLRTFRQPL
jgi:uncharacterized protein (UPF0276 family)